MSDTPRTLTPDELAFIVRVQHDVIVSLLDERAEAARDQWENGRLAAYREHAEWGKHLRELIRAGADHSTTYAQRRAAEIEWAKPKPGDYTGRLSAAEYFGGDDTPEQVTAMERRAAA